MIDPAKIRRESIRWMILLTLNNARPIGAWEELIQSTIQAVYTDITPMELRRELEYLHARRLMDLKKDPAGRWEAQLTRYGTDVAEYTVECDPGIARPQKYW